MKDKLKTFLFSFFILQCIVIPTVLDILKLFTIVAIFIVSFNNFKLRINDRKFVALLLIILIYNFFQTVVGYFTFGHTALEEGKLTVIYLALFLVLSLAINAEKLERYNKIIVIGALFNSLYFFYNFLGQTNALPYAGDFLSQNFRISYGTGIIKINSENMFTYSFLLPYLIYKSILLIKVRNHNFFLYLNTLLSILVVVITLRRGFLVSSFLSLFLIFAIIERRLLKSLIVVLICIPVFYGFLLIYVNYFSKVKAETYIKTIETSFDFNRNYSNSLRRQQYIILKDAILKKPLFGYGIGAYFDNYTRSKKYPSNFELQYMKMLFATGIFGFLLNFLLFLYGTRRAIVLIKNNSFHYNNLTPILCGFLSLVITNGTNPIISQLAGLFLYFYMFWFIFPIEKQCDDAI